MDLLDLKERSPAAVEFRFARHVAASELPAWQRQVARSLQEVGEVVPDLAPKPPGARDEYLLVEYVHPFRPHNLGRDLLVDPSRQAATARVRFRVVSEGWRWVERELYRVFCETFGAPPLANRMSP